MPDENGIIWIDDAIDAMPKERLFVAVARACKERGIEYEWTTDGHLNTEIDPDEFIEDALFQEAFEIELKKMVAEDILRELSENGIIESSRVDENGEVVWKKTGELES